MACTIDRMGGGDGVMGTGHQPICPNRDGDWYKWLCVSSVTVKLTVDPPVENRPSPTNWRGAIADHTRLSTDGRPGARTLNR